MNRMLLTVGPGLFYEVSDGDYIVWKSGVKLPVIWNNGDIEPRNQKEANYYYDNVLTDNEYFLLIDFLDKNIPLQC